MALVAILTFFLFEQATNAPFEPPIVRILSFFCVGSVLTGLLLAKHVTGIKKLKINRDHTFFMIDSSKWYIFEKKINLIFYGNKL